MERDIMIRQQAKQSGKQTGHRKRLSASREQ
nr:MAG TPA: hypothetical protein [Caudoviricetes sp.]